MNPSLPAGSLPLPNQRFKFVALNTGDVITSDCLVMKDGIPGMKQVPAWITGLKLPAGFRVFRRVPLYP